MVSSKITQHLPFCVLFRKCITSQDAEVGNLESHTRDRRVRKRLNHVQAIISCLTMFYRKHKKNDDCIITKMIVELLK